MKFLDLIRIIWKNMWKRRTRTIFTMMGVIIGCIAVFIISSLTNGFEKYLNEEIEGLMDTSVITLMPFWGESSEEDSSKEENKQKTKLDDKCVEELEKLDFLSEIMPKKYAYTQMKLGKKESYGRMLARDIYNDGEESLLAGRYPKEKSKELLIGYDIAKELLGYNYDEEIKDEIEFHQLIDKKIKLSNSMGNYDEQGNPIQMKSVSVRIVGILKNKSGHENYLIQAPVKLVDDIIKSAPNLSKEDLNRQLKTYEEIAVRVTEKNNLEEYEEILKSMGYSTMSFKDFEKSTKAMLMGVSLILGTLAGVSLLVAALGITNTMDMAIYERNKEIGVIKVIGGSLNDVRKIFVGEACAISFSGGVIAIVVGCGINAIINSVAKSITQSLVGQPIDRIAVPSIGLILGILLFSLFIGFIAGILPANKAAKTDVISAIR